MATGGPEQQACGALCQIQPCFRSDGGGSVRKEKKGMTQYTTARSLSSFLLYAGIFCFIAECIMLKSGFKKSQEKREKLL
jgi:hypothetical protein